MNGTTVRSVAVPKVSAEYLYLHSTADAMTAGVQFSTFDRDQDSWADGSCSQRDVGAWWYSDCGEANLNSDYNIRKWSDGSERGVYWGGCPDFMKSTAMMVRCWE